MMDDATAAYLNRLNQDFYAQHAATFDDTRRGGWAGWKRLAPHLSDGLRVWDAGCGNGRFAHFLAARLAAFTYLGTDSSPALLAMAAHKTANIAGVQLAQHDLTSDPPPEGPFGLIALFGVLHHLPGAARRAALMSALAERLAPGGLLAFTAWRFADYPRFLERALPWEQASAPFPLQVEPGDYLLDWQRDLATPRYCHHVDDAEHAALIAATGLAVADDYRADGFDAAVNRYTLLRRA